MEEEPKKRRLNFHDERKGYIGAKKGDSTVAKRRANGDGVALFRMKEMTRCV